MVTRFLFWPILSLPLLLKNKKIKNNQVLICAPEQLRRGCFEPFLIERLNSSKQKIKIKVEGYIYYCTL
ncbi:hypothetical protein V6Z11_A11G119300 [Gossypium hirsutum]